MAEPQIVFFEDIGIDENSPWAEEDAFARLPSPNGNPLELLLMEEQDEVDMMPIDEYRAWLASRKNQ